MKGVWGVDKIDFNNILQEANAYYSDRIRKYGATNQGVDWNSIESQELRFAQLAKIFADDDDFSICDYGCGYGGLVDYLHRMGKCFQYFGVDVSAAMIEKGQDLYRKDKQVHFLHGSELLADYDYVVSSGIFNVRGEKTDNLWKEYMLEVVQSFQNHARKGFAFNCLTKYSDLDKMKNYLYYADPLFWFDYAKNNYSKNVALLHDYGLYEFTILVRK